MSQPLSKRARPASPGAAAAPAPAAAPAASAAAPAATPAAAAPPPSFPAPVVAVSTFPPTGTTGRTPVQTPLSPAPTLSCAPHCRAAALLAAIESTQRDCLAQGPSVTIFSTMLSRLIAITESAFGFIGEVFDYDFASESRSAAAAATTATAAAMAAAAPLGCPAGVPAPTPIPPSAYPLSSSSSSSSSSPSPPARESSSGTPAHAPTLAAGPTTAAQQQAPPPPPPPPWANAWLLTHAITDIAWNEQTKAFVVSQQHQLQFHSLDSLWGAAITSGSHIISNDPPADPRSSGRLPPGHPPLFSFICLRLVSGGSRGELLGLVGLANKPGGYAHADIVFLEPLLQTCSNMIAALRIERLREQEERLKNEFRAEAERRAAAERCLQDTLATMETVIEQRSAESDRAKRAAEEAASAKSRFLAAMSHEIRTPLTSVVGMVSMLRARERSEDDDLWMLDVIQTSGDTLLTFLDDVLDYSRLEGHDTATRPSLFSPQRLTEEAAFLSAFRLQRKPGLELLLDLDPTRATRAVGDPSRIKQVLLNLLSNATKFTEAGSVELRFDIVHAPAVPAAAAAAAGAESTGAAAEAAAPPARVLQWDVSDEGIGILPEDQCDLFQPFFRSSQNRQTVGTGLGLAISFKLAQAMGGTLALVHTAPHEGSTFRLSIPFVPEESPAATAAAATAAAAAAAARPRTDIAAAAAAAASSSSLFDADASQLLADAEFLRGKTVLLVEDHARVASSLSTLFERHLGCLVTWTASAPFVALPAMAATFDLLVVPRAYLPVVAPPQLLSAATRTLVVMPIEDSVQVHTKAPEGRAGFTVLSLKKPILFPALVAVCRRLYGLVPRPPTEATATAASCRRASVLAAAHSTRVLIVDDNEVNLMMLEHMLKKLQFRCARALSGERAVELFVDASRASDPFTVCLVDLFMPVYDGLETVRRIRAFEGENKLPRAKLICVTAAAIADEADKCYSAGFDGFLQKPFKMSNVEHLLLSISSAPSSFSSASAAAAAASAASSSASPSSTSSFSSPPDFSTPSFSSSASPRTC